MSDEHQTADETHTVRLSPDRVSISLVDAVKALVALLALAGVFFALRGAVDENARELRQHSIVIDRHTREEYPGVRSRVRNLEESVRTIERDQRSTLDAVKEIRDEVRNTLSDDDDERTGRRRRRTQ